VDLDSGPVKIAMQMMAFFLAGRKIALTFQQLLLLPSDETSVSDLRQVKHLIAGASLEKHVL